MKNTNTMNTDTDTDKTPLTALIFGIIVGLLFGLSLAHYFSTEPLRQEAIKRGYASYVLKNPLNSGSVEFVWNVGGN